MITITIIAVIKAFLLAWLIIIFEPLQKILTKIKSKISDKYWFVYYLKEILSCHKCSAFWIGMLMTNNFWIALAAAFCGYFYDCLIKPNLTKL